MCIAIQYRCENGEQSRCMLHVVKLNCYLVMLVESELYFIGLSNTKVIYQGSAYKLLFAFVLVKSYDSLVLQKKTFH